MFSITSATTRALSVAGAALALVIAAPGAGAAGPDQTQDADEAPVSHEMGSQIRKHEGGAALNSTSATAKALQAETEAAGTVSGIDVSDWQPNVNWADEWNQGNRFAWVKATEGTTYTSPSFDSQYAGSYDQGFIRGAYHFALPDTSSGAEQAKYFSDNGGGWSGDGKTLPGALDIEWNPYGDTCYGLTQAQMTQWIQDFSDYYHDRWGKYPIIYTATSWWSQCVGNSSFSATNPLWVANYNGTADPLPFDWGFYTVWQYTSEPFDHNTFNGTEEQLTTFATEGD